MLSRGQEFKSPLGHHAVEVLPPPPAGNCHSRTRPFPVTVASRRPGATARPRAQPDHPDVDLDVIQPTCWITPRGALRTGPRHGLPGRGLRPTDEYRGPARSIRSYQSPHRPRDPP